MNLMTAIPRFQSPGPPAKIKFGAWVEIKNIHFDPTDQQMDEIADQILENEDRIQSLPLSKAHKEELEGLLPEVRSRGTDGKSLLKGRLAILSAFNLKPIKYQQILPSLRKASSDDVYRGINFVSWPLQEKRRGRGIIKLEIADVIIPSAKKPDENEMNVQPPGEDVFKRTALTQVIDDIRQGGPFAMVPNDQESVFRIATLHHANLNFKTLGSSWPVNWGYYKGRDGQHYLVNPFQKTIVLKRPPVYEWVGE